MNKSRIESLSDCVFSVAMTVLIFNIKVPSLTQPLNGHELIAQLSRMWPLFRSYYISFAILGMYWIAHHTLFHYFAKHANATLTYFNILFLCLITLIPFSTHLIGEYPMNTVAVTIYGLNVILIGAVQYWMFLLTIRDPDVRHEGVTQQLIIQSTVRMMIPPVFAVLGIIAGFYHSSVSFFLFAIPVVFNIIPHSSKFLEDVFIKIRGQK